MTDKTNSTVTPKYEVLAKKPTVPTANPAAAAVTTENARNAALDALIGGVRKVSALTV